MTRRELNKAVDIATDLDNLEAQLRRNRKTLSSIKKQNILRPLLLIPTESDRFEVALHCEKEYLIELIERDNLLSERKIKELEKELESL